MNAPALVETPALPVVPQKSRFPLWAAALILLMVTVAAHLPALRGALIWDDDAYLTENRYVFYPTGPYVFWFEPKLLDDLPYYPMVFMSYWLEQPLWGRNPVGYHATNILLHAVNALLLWRILVGVRFRGAWVAALLFAVHPMTVESVAWIAERKNVLALFFGLLCAMTYLRFTDVIPSSTRKWKLYSIALLTFFLALASKTAICMLPFVLLALVWWRRKVTERDLLAIVPFLFVAAAMSLITALQYGGHNPALNLSVMQRMEIVGDNLWFYGQKMLWPWPLLTIYPRWDVASLHWWNVIPLIATVVLLAVLIATKSRGAAVGWAAIGLLLLPVLGMMNFSFLLFSFVADHFAYFALPIAICMATWLAGVLLQRKSSAAIVVGIVAAAFVVMTWQQATLYSSSERLWRHTLAYNNSWFPKYALGYALIKEKRYAEAVPLLRESTAEYSGYAETHLWLAVALHETGRSEEALDVLHTAETVRPSWDTATMYEEKVRGSLRERQAATLKAAATTTRPR